MKRELLDFSVNAKKFLELFDTREKSRDWLFVFSLSTRWTISADYNGLYGNQVFRLENCGGEKVRQGWLMFKRKKTVPLMRQNGSSIRATASLAQEIRHTIFSRPFEVVFGGKWGLGAGRWVCGFSQVSDLLLFTSLILQSWFII